MAEPLDLDREVESDLTNAQSNSSSCQVVVLFNFRPWYDHVALLNFVLEI